MLNELNLILKLLSRKQKIVSSILIFVTLIGTVFETIGILLITPIIQLIQNPDSFITKNYMLIISNILNLKSGQKLLNFFLITLVIFYLLKSMLLGLLYWYQNTFVYSLKYNMTNKLLSIYFHQPWSFHFSRNSALLMRNVNTDMILFSETLKSWIILFAEVFFVFTVGSLILIYQPRAMMIVLFSFCPIVWLFNGISNNLIKKSRTERYVNDSEKIKFLKQGLDGIKDLIINGNENFYLQKFKSPNYAEVNSTRQFMTFQQFPRLWLEALSVLAFAALLIISLSNSSLMGILPFMGILALSMFKLLPSINRIIVSIQNILYNHQSIQSICNELLLEENILIPKGSSELHFNSHIMVENVSFSYPQNQTQVLQNINICIKKGSVTGIIGKTGSGKSTFLNLMVGLIKPSDGTFFVDAKNIHTDINVWRSKISYIPQTVYLFDDSIKNNIAFGFQPEQINELELLFAIKLAGLEDFINVLPDGVDTKVGEAGIRLSGGERQRIGIARALYKNSEILILDEATNALDNETEKKILKNIVTLAQDKTIIIISHHITSLSICNKIYAIDKGRMQEINPVEKI